MTGQLALEAAIDAVLAAQDVALLPKDKAANSDSPIDALAEQWHSTVQSVALTKDVDTDVLTGHRDRPSHLTVLAKVFSVLAAISCVSLMVALSVPKSIPADDNLLQKSVAVGIAPEPKAPEADAQTSKPVKARKLLAKRVTSKASQTASKSRRR